MDFSQVLALIQQLQDQVKALSEANPPPPPTGPTEAEIQARIDAAVQAQKDQDSASLLQAVTTENARCIQAAKDALESEDSKVLAAMALPQV